MEFHLTRELIDQVMFGMENQDSDFVLDIQEQRVVRVDQIADAAEIEEERYIPLPEWRSVDGYNLMEKFVASLHNPIYREILRRILTSGRGVFRQFKDALKERKEIERLWYNFKEREMRSRVIEWYNVLRDSWGLARIGDPEEESTEALVLSDFTIEVLSARGEVSVNAETSGIEPPPTRVVEDIVVHLDGLGYAECYPDLPEHLVHYLQQRRSRLLTLPSAPESRIIGMFTPANDLAGFLWAMVDDVGDGRLVAAVQQIYVLPEYRGLGLARTLFLHYCTIAYHEKVETLLLELPGVSDFMVDMFETEGGEHSSHAYTFNVTRWYAENVEPV